VHQFVGQHLRAVRSERDRSLAARRSDGGVGFVRALVA
jgi:hypothetical protein